MAILAKQTEWGYYVTCTGGTAAATLITLSPSESVKVCGIAVGGTATSDIITVYDGNAITPVYSNVGSNPGALAALQLAMPIRVRGISIAMAGGTSAVAYIYTSNQ